MKKEFFALTSKDRLYPAKLKQIDGSPKKLYLKTSLSEKEVILLFKKPSLAIVGSREMTPYGKRVTEDFVSKLSKKGVVIVSGMARGIDTIAHKTALENNGLTIAVLGCGVDVVYPRENLGIYNDIIGGGAVVSEFAPGTSPEAKNFPVRNRIISGISDAVLVIEAAKRSGTLITARWAADQGKEVLVVPGPITSLYSEGVNWLIKQGAKPVSSIEEILEELSF